MILGFSFGKKKATTSETSNLTKNEAMTGSQSQATTGSTVGSSATTSAGTSQTAGFNNAVQTTSQAQADQGVQSQTGKTTTLGSDVTGGLSAAVKSLLSGGVNDANIAGISNLISDTTTGFNPAEFIQQTVGAARNRGEQTLQESTSSFNARAGGTSATNSMAALLAQRGRNDLEANIAGITAAATGQANDIRNKNLGTAAGAQSSLAESATMLGQVLKGAETTVDMKTLTDQISQLLGTQSNAATTGSSTQTSEQQNTATSQLVSELVAALTQQNTATVGTQDTKGKTKSGGGGVSLSI